MRAGTRTTVSWSGTGFPTVISDIVRSSAIFHPWMTMLPSSSSTQTVGEPLLGESGSLPTNRRVMMTSMIGHCGCLHSNRASLHENRQDFARCRLRLRTVWRDLTAMLPISTGWTKYEVRANSQLDAQTDHEAHVVISRCHSNMAWARADGCGSVPSCWS